LAVGEAILPLIMTKAEDVQHTLFVRNINYITTREALEGLFGQFGKVARARIIYANQRGNNVSRGFGFVDFDVVEPVNKALSAGPLELDGRTLEVRPARPREPRKRDTAFIRGIPVGTTEAMIREAFAKYNPVEVRIPRSNTAESSGFAFVRFDTEEDQTKAVNDNRSMTLNGGESHVFYARPRRGWRGRPRGPRSDGPRRAPRAKPTETASS
jgi:RNA recognition motif-containing protein